MKKPNKLTDRSGRKLSDVLFSYLLVHRRLFRCSREFHGTEYGGWMICPDGLTKSSVVYSFGVGEDASFDLSLIARYGPEVCGFDPTPKSIAWVEGQTWPAQFHFHPFGIGASDRMAAFFAPDNPEWISHTILPRDFSAQSATHVQLLRLQTIAEMLGHQEIAILKMDIEGAEYEVIGDLVKTPTVKVRQVLVEFHHWLYPGISVRATHAAIRKLEKAGYKLFAISDKGLEFSFIRP